MTPLKIILITLGTISLGIGILGIFIPGLPTTPFLLLTSGLYVRSSDKLYNRLISNKYIGNYIKTFREKKGMSLRLKVYSIFIMWIMISISSFLTQYPLNAIIIVFGVIGTIVMGFVIRTSN